MEKWFEKAVQPGRTMCLHGWCSDPQLRELLDSSENMDLTKRSILDHNLYVFNRYAKQFLEQSWDVSMYTAPVELNAGELGTLGIDDGELIVYGYLPVMVSAQCVRKNSAGCTGKNGTMNAHGPVWKYISGKELLPAVL